MGAVHAASPGRRKAPLAASRARCGWYGVKRFFQWLETKSYKMHIRVLLSKYRAYELYPACRGARLKPEALLWRLGTREDADRVLPGAERCRPLGMEVPPEVCASLPGLTVHELACLPIARCGEFFASLHLPAPLDQATELLLGEIRARLAKDQIHEIVRPRH